MWVIKSSYGRIFYVREDKDVFIGRSGEVCDLVLSGDSSVSRRHAVLHVENGQLSLQDLGSKYGTFINNNIERKTPIVANSSVSLNANDRFRIGTMENTWTVDSLSLITCTSTMKGENLEEMKKDLEVIGASLQNEWDHTCTHLTMPAITLTVKVLAALAFGRHIVTADFWKAWRRVMTNGGNPPNPTDYLPEVIENTLNKESVSFIPDDRRMTIFAGKQFIFFSRSQMSFYKMILERCGATVGHLKECKLTKSKLCADNVVVVQFSGSMPGQETQSQRQIINDIINFMNEKSRRVIPDIEIGLAILLISTEKYCNPKRNLLQLFQKPDENPDQNENAKILAPETQEVDQVKIDQSGVVIEESLLSSNNNESSGNNSQKQAMFVEPAERIKRKLQDTDVQTQLENIQKKPALSITSTQSKTGDDGMFDFVHEPTAVTASSKSPGKRLNFLKPKNRQNANTDDDIFNFVPDNKDNDKPKSCSGQNSHQSSLFTERIKCKPGSRDVELRPSSSEVNSCHSSIFTTITTKRKQQDAESPHPKKPHIEIAEPLRLREVKTDILELLKNSFWKSCTDEIAKREMVKMELEDPNGTTLNFGDTIVSVCSNLIVKTETSVSFHNSSYSGPNFKKFKKVIPLRMQVTVIPSSSMSMYRPEPTAEQTVELHSSDDEDERIWMQQNKKGKKYALR